MELLEMEIVKEEIEKVYMEHKRQQEINGPEADRCVDYDVQKLKDAILSLEPLLTREATEVTTSCMNMWEVCHNAFDNILLELGLTVDMEDSSFDDYLWVIKPELERSMYEIIFPEVEHLVFNEMDLAEELTEEDIHNITLRICEERDEDSKDFWVCLSEVEKMTDKDDWSEVSGCIQNMIEKYQEKKFVI